MAQQTLTTAAGTAISRALPFPARTAIISNNSSAWCSVPGNGWPIPPWQNGVVLPLAAATQTASLAWGPPAGIAVTPIDTTQGLVGVWTDDPLSFDPGRPTQTTGNAGILLGQFTAALGGTTISQRFTIPQGVDGLFVIVDSASGFPAGSEISVADPTLTRDYGTFGPILAPPLGTGWLVFPVEPSIDPTVVVVAQLGGSGPAVTIRVLAITHPAVQLSVIIGNETPISVIGVPGSGAAGTPVNTAGQGGSTIGVGFATHATATVTLPAGTATQKWHVLAVTASLNGAGASAVNMTDGSSTWGAFIGNTAQRVTEHFDFPDGGAAFGAGNAVTITISDPGAGITSNLGVVADLRNF